MIKDKEKSMRFHKKWSITFLLFVGVNVYSATRLHILFIVGHFPAPSQIFILNMITGLIDRGHKVSIFSFHKDALTDLHPNIKKYDLLEHITYKTFPKKLPKCDIVFCQFGYIGKMIAAQQRLSQWLKKRKLVVCFRGSDTTSYVQQNPTIYRQLFYKGDFFLPVCDYFKQKLINLGCSAHKIAVHYSAIDCSKFGFSVRSRPINDEIVLVSTCRLVKKKGIDDAIKAFAHVIQKYPKLHYFIIGDGSERTYLELLIYQLNLQNNVTLCGWKNQDELVSLLNKAHIFLLPSKRGDDGNEEGIPNALKEAMAMGLIAIGTWHAGTPELIDHGKSGFLVPENNVCQLARTIEHVIEHPEIWQSIGLSGRKKVEKHFETKQSIKKLEKIFYQLLGYHKN